MRRTLTLALSARCPVTSDFGLAFVSTDPPSEALTFQANRLAGQCLQAARPQTQLNRKVLALIARDLTPQEALNDALSESVNADQRLVLALAADGRAAGHTGAALKAAARYGWTGHLCDTNFAVAGLGLPDAELASRAHALLVSESGAQEVLSERLMRTLKEIAPALAGPGLPLVSAGLHITGEDPYPLIDLRVDMDTDPVARLAEIYEDYMAEDILEDALLPTAEHPHGIPPTGWGETKRYAIRKFREARRQWKKRRGSSG